MFPRWLAAMHGQSHRCKAKQSRRGKTAPTSGSYFHSSTVFGRHQEVKRISLVTMAGAFCNMVQRSDFRCGQFTFTQSRGRNLGVVPASECPEKAAMMNIRWPAIRNRVRIHYLAARVLGDHGG
jgi:hypothetical protein